MQSDAQTIENLAQAPPARRKRSLDRPLNSATCCLF